MIGSRYGYGEKKWDSQREDIALLWDRVACMRAGASANQARTNAWVLRCSANVGRARA